MSTVKTYKGHDVPELARYYAAKSGAMLEGFYNDDKSRFIGVDFGDVWGSASFNRKNMVELPQDPETFVPVVGEECEVSMDFNHTKARGNWAVIEVMYVDEATVVGRIIESESLVHMYSNGFEANLYVFRPSKSEREKVIEAALGGVSGVLETPEVLLFVNKLFDAGMLVMQESE